MIETLKRSGPSWIAHLAVALLLGWVNMHFNIVPGGKWIGAYLYVGKELFALMDHVIWWAIINPGRIWRAFGKPEWQAFPTPEVLRADPWGDMLTPLIGVWLIL